MRRRGASTRLTGSAVTHRLHRQVTLPYLSKLRHIPVGAAHRNRKVLLFVAVADVRGVATDGTLLRQLTLDPSRSYQPLGGRWPVHNVLRQASTMS